MKNFLRYVEIQTKVASVTPFLIGTLFAKYRYGSIIVDNFLVMLVSLLCFDMATTAINNYFDYKKSNIIRTKHEVHTSNASVVENGISIFMAKLVIIVLLSIAVLFGILLVYMTNLLVLMIGVISFIVGILYTFGPIPISRMPLGEIFSGFFMGFVIMFLSIYIHVFNDGVAGIFLLGNTLSLDVNLVEITLIFLVSIPSMACIANIMLANNICDLEEDVLNNRFTLVYYLGRKASLTLYKVLYLISYVDVFLLVVMHVLPPVALLVLFTYIPVSKAIAGFYESQVKSRTFIFAVKNFMAICGAQLISILIALVYRVIA